MRLFHWSLPSSPFSSLTCFRSYLPRSRSVLKGGVTTFLGCIPLAFASSSAFVTFFKMMFCTVFLGVMHGLVALPVFLATYYNLMGGLSNKKEAEGGVGREEVFGSKLAEGARTKKEIEQSKNGGVVSETKVENKKKLRDLLKSSSSVFFGINPMRKNGGKGERMKRMPPAGGGGGKGVEDGL